MGQRFQRLRALNDIFECATCGFDMVSPVKVNKLSREYKRLLKFGLGLQTSTDDLRIRTPPQTLFYIPFLPISYLLILKIKFYTYS